MLRRRLSLRAKLFFGLANLPGQMFAVGEGEIDIQLNGQTVETVGPGGVFGEMGLIDNQPRSANAVARTATEVVAIDERRFAFLVQNNPYFPLNVMRTMTA